MSPKKYQKLLDYLQNQTDTLSHNYGGSIYWCHPDNYNYAFNLISDFVMNKEKVIRCNEEIPVNRLFYAPPDHKFVYYDSYDYRWLRLLNKGVMVKTNEPGIIIMRKSENVRNRIVTFYPNC